MAKGYAIEELSRSGLVSAISLKTVEPHPFVVGDKVRLYNVPGGGTASFMRDNPYTVATVSDSGASTFYRLTLSGNIPLNSASMVTTTAITAGTVYANSNQYVLITTADALNLQAEPRIRIRGVTHPLGNIELIQFINSPAYGQNVTVVSPTQFILKLHRPQQTWTPGGSAIVWTTGTVEYVPSGAVIALDDGINVAGGRIGGIGIDTYRSRVYRIKQEGEVVAALLGLAAESKGVDYPFLRMFDTTDTSRLSKSPLRSAISLNTAATSLRSAMDSVIEKFQGADAKKRRYFVDPDGRMVYEITSESVPATATAPYKIITTGPGSPNLSNAAATVAPYSLTLNWDQDTTKRALFTSSTRNGAPIADLIKVDSPDALGTAYKRLGAPYFDDAVDYPSGTDERLISRQNASRSFFLERHAPILSGSFTLRGAGTASWNNLGFSAGYASITVPGSATIYPPAPFPTSRDGGTASFSTMPYKHNFVIGMPIVISQIAPANYCGTFTVSGTPSATKFEYGVSGSFATQGTASGDPSVTAYGLFVRTGTAPNQIVTVTMPTQHGITNGATVTVSGLTGASGTSMNGTATATVLSQYSFTYPSTGTNGTATGIGTVAATSLVPRWEPGQWVDLTSAELGLSGLYRVEAVDWMLEPGSFQQVITVTFNRRPGKTLTKLLRETT
jgi:hypothetical protein